MDKCLQFKSWSGTDWLTLGYWPTKWPWSSGCNKLEMRQFFCDYYQAIFQHCVNGIIQNDTLNLWDRFCEPQFCFACHLFSTRVFTLRGLPVSCSDSSTIHDTSFLFLDNTIESGQFTFQVRIFLIQLVCHLYLISQFYS